MRRERRAELFRLSTVDLDAALPYGGARVPSMLSYKNMAANDSMFKSVSLASSFAHRLRADFLPLSSTPPTFTIYICSLVLRSLLETPPLPLASGDRPLSPLSSYADKKSSLVYSLLDAPDGFYLGTADKDVRSRMNVTFRLKGGEALEKKFVAEASEKGIKGVGGHRSVGGECWIGSDFREERC